MYLILSVPAFCDRKCERPHSVTAKGASGAKCFCINRANFERVLGPLKQLMRRSMRERGLSSPAAAPAGPAIRFEDLEILRTLGTGTFGRVRLVKHKQTQQVYAFKILQKARIVAFQQQKNTMNEKNIRGLEDMLDANLSDDGAAPERPRAPSTRARSASVESLESELDDDDAAPPHALDAIIPIEEASERGERALLALARVENSGTRVPLALLTILSFTLGLAGGVYLLLPFGRDSCQPLALVLANSYIAFFYIFFVPNLLICIVAIIELTSINPEDHRLQDILERTMARLDDIFFLGQVPLCTFFAKRLLLKSTAPPLDGARLKALLRRDAYILKHRRETLKTALDDCDEQIAAVDSIRKRARLAYKKKDTIDPFAETPGLRVRRYSRFVPEVSWHQSFVPVYREVDPATPLDGYDPNFPRTAVSPIKLFGNTFRLQSPRRASDASEGRRDSEASEFEFYDAL